MSTPVAGTVVTQEDTNITTPGTTTAFSVTTGSGETYLLVRIAIKRGSPTVADVSSITFGATSLAQLTSANQVDSNANIRGVLWGGFVSASTTDTLTITWNGVTGNVLIAATPYSGVDSVGTVASTVATAGTTISVNLSGAANSLSVDMVITHSGDNSPAVGSGQSADFTAFVSTGGSAVRLSGSSGAAEVAMDWTGLSHGNDDAVQLAVPLVGTGGGGGFQAALAARSNVLIGGGLP